MQYKQFTEGMIGKRVRELGHYGTYDEGIVNRVSDFSSSRAYVDWLTGARAGECLNIDLRDIEFIPHPEEALPEILIINGLRYQLVRD